jgi:antitoxin component of MazEF toxin-antitoxin module
MAQKIITIGSSVGVTIPKEILQRSGVGLGDSVSVEFEESTAGIRILPLSRKTKASDTATWATNFVQKHIAAFKELADK